MIRAPYIEHYRTPTNNLLYYIVLWFNVETAIDCIACSLPSLRRFILRTTKVDSSKDALEILNPTGLVTFGSTPIGGRNGTKSRGVFGNPSDAGVSFATVHAHGDGDWKRLSDGDSHSSSQLDMTGGSRIHADYTYEVELSKPSEKNKSRPRQLFKTKGLKEWV